MKHFRWKAVAIATAMVVVAMGQTVPSSGTALGMTEAEAIRAFGTPIKVLHLKGGVTPDGSPRAKMDVVTFADRHKKHFEIVYRDGKFMSLSYPPHSEHGMPRASWRKAVSDLGIGTPATQLKGSTLAPTGTKMTVSWLPMQDGGYGLLVYRK